ncbi:MAG: hypothetical protein CL910_14715 [Deltaproteobacteria bacterium]|nr:hypothetical protein [Deltaproteobacteria bacterium]
MTDHWQRLDERARALAEELELAALQPPREATTAARRAFESARQGILRKGREILQDHWDVGLFDVGFGSVKAFGVYPALFFAGWTWLIPLLEVAVLNTQVWTAGYLLLRREWLSIRCRRRTGRPLKELLAYRARVFGLRPEDATGLHRFEADGREWTLRIRRSAARHAWRCWRHGSPEPNTLLQRELRGLVADPVFRFLANPYRNNAPLYERILLARILAHRQERARLLARLVPECERRGVAAVLIEVLGEQGTDLAVARVVAAGDRLVAALREGLGTGFSATSLSLRWIHWSYQRKIYGLLARQERWAEQVLADWISGARRETVALREHAAVRLEASAWTRAMEAYGERAGRVDGPLAARAAIARGIAEAQGRGLPVRLARCARAVSPTHWRLLSRPVEPVAPPDWSALAAREEELEAQWSALLAARQGYRGVRRRLAKRSGRAPSDDELRAGDEAQREFQEGLDQHLRALHLAHVQQVRADLGRAIHQVWSFYGPRRSRTLRRGHQAVERLGERYLELEGLYGSPRDHQRIACFQRFHAKAVIHCAALRALDPTAPPVPVRGVADRVAGLGRWLRRLPGRCAWLARLVAECAGLLGAVLARGASADGTPFTRRVDGVFGAWGRLQDWEIEVRGAEHLHPPVGEGGVHVLTPAHRHGVTDNATFAALGCSDYLVFNAVDQLPLLPAWLKERIAATPGLIPVGGGRGSAVEAALGALGEGRSRNLLIYPEGSVSEGLRATRPPRPGFGSGLVQRLREAGHRVRITPVTYLDNARFLDLPARGRGPGDTRRRVVVSPPLLPEAVDRVALACGGEALGRLVRNAWLENLVSDDDLWLGTERVASIQRRLDAELEGARYWGSLEAAAVDDLLEPTLGTGPIRGCEEPFHGKRVRVFRLPDDAVDPHGAVPLESLRRPGSRELVLGIRDPAHIYLNVGSRRFDGDVFRPLRVRRKESLYRGIAIRFVGLPARAVHAIEAELERLAGRERRTLTCSHSACKLIARAANLRIGDRGEWRPVLPSHVFPTRTMRKLIEQGVLDHGGRRVEVQVYKTDDRPLEEILAQMRMGERKIVRDHVDLLWGALTGKSRGSG